MKYGIALEGGGAKGAYHAGALKALEDLNIPIGGVTGTSIGAINGAYFLQKNANALIEFWESLNPSYLFPETLIHLHEFLINKKTDNYLGLAKEIRGIISEGGVSLEPFKKTLYSHIDEGVLRKLDKDFGLVTFSLTDMKPVEIMLKDIPDGELMNYLIASSYLPGFKREKLFGKSFVDGAFYDNLPVNLLVKAGYKNIIAIELLGVGIKKRPKDKDLKIISIRPSDDTGRSIDFESGLSYRNIQMGYYDTLRIFKNYYGQWFYLEDIWSPERAFDFLNDLSKDQVIDLCQDMNLHPMPYKRCLFEHIIPTWMSLLKIPPKADYNMILLYLLEYIGKVLDLDRYQIITMDELIEMIREHLYAIDLEDGTWEGLVSKFLKATNLYKFTFKEKVALSCAKKIIISSQKEAILNYKEKYQAWLNNDYFDQDFRQELKALEGNEKEIEERFYTDLAFGTGGMRGIIGAGTNRMNKYVLRKASQGFANYALNNYDNNSIVIAYDCRHKSEEFALETGLVFAANGIKAYMFKSLRSTPELSFAVRRLKATVGVVVTASHNPPEYNGFKVYGDDGCQLLPKEADQVVAEVNKIEGFEQVNYMEKDQALQEGLLVYLDDKEDEAYLDMVESVAIDSEIIETIEDLKLVYTPLHGTGGRPVSQMLKRRGLKHFYPVQAQMIADPDFSTLKSPNPEDFSAFEMAIDLAKEKDADVAVATDPDCDRVGVVVRNKGEYQPLNGNQLGVLLVDYILSNIKNMPSNPLIVNTIVTSGMAEKIIKSHGALLESTLTGFKFIGEKIKENENTDKTFLFGYEESYGYLAGTHVRDKDAVIATMLVAEMVAKYKQAGKTLMDRLHELYEDFGYYQEDLSSIVLKGKEGVEKIKEIMSTLRSEPFEEVAGKKVVKIMDCLNQVILEGDKTKATQLPKSDVLKFFLEDGSWIAARPSGTEPKLKLYYSISGHTLKACQIMLSSVKDQVLDRVHKI